MLKDEINFWRELQKKYLEPLKENKEQQEKVAHDLRELRNKVSKRNKACQYAKSTFYVVLSQVTDLQQYIFVSMLLAFLFLTGYI